MEKIKKVIIPTDFSVKSLSLVVDVIERSRNEKLEIVLLHGMVPSDSISDLLFQSRSKIVRTLQTDEFYDSCNLIKNKYQSRIKSMYADIITGNSSAYFNNYIDGGNIDEVYIPVGFEMNYTNARSFDVSELLRLAPVKQTEINWPAYSVHHTVPTGQVADLFLARS